MQIIRHHAEMLREIRSYVSAIFDSDTKMSDIFGLIIEDLDDAEVQLIA